MAATTATPDRQRRRQHRRKEGFNSNSSVLSDVTPPRDIKNRSQQRLVAHSPSSSSLLSAASNEKLLGKKMSPVPRIRVPPTYSLSETYSTSGEDIGRSSSSRHQPRDFPTFDAPSEEDQSATSFTPAIEQDSARLAIAQKLILRMFMDENSSDVKFVVSDNLRNEDANAPPPQIFHSHRFILEECCPELARLCEANENSDGSHTIVPIDGMEPEVFHRVLYHVYGGKVDDLDGCATKVIEAADKYNLLDLKVEAEEVYADSCHLTVDNLLYHILYADTRDCGALKDNIIDFIIDHEEEVSDKVSVIVEEESRTLVWNW